MLPTSADVHVDRTLTDISVAFLQDTSHFVSHRVFANVPVPQKSDRYFVYDRGDFNRNQATKRAPDAESSGGGYRLDNTPTFFCDVWAHHHPIPWQVISNADQAVQLERAGAAYVMHQLLIAKEVDWSTTFFTGGVWSGGDVDGVASSAGTNEVIQWSDATSGDPIGNIRDAKTAVLERTGFMPNTLVITQPVMDALEDHPDIVDRVKYSGGVGNGNPARVSEQTLAQLFGLDRIVVARAIQNTADEGQTDSHSFILGKKALLVYVPPAPGLMIPAAGYTFSWQGYLGTTNEFGIATKRFDITHRSTTWIEGEMAFDHKLVSPELGYFWDSIVA